MRLRIQGAPMSEGVIEPAGVYPPAGSQRFYQTYNTRYVNGGGPPPPSQGGPSFDYSGGRTYNFFQRLPQGAMSVGVPTGVPRFLGARPIIFYMWMVAIGMVVLDEWHTHHILPRPARLWWTTVAFLLMAALATIDAMVPLVNAFAIGMVIVLGYQYYSGTGAFGSTGLKEAQANANAQPGTVTPDTGLAGGAAQTAAGAVG